MEKKIYETPTIEIVEIESEGVLCASVPGAGEGSFNDYDEIGW